MARITDTVKIIIIVNVLFFIGSFITNSESILVSYYPEYQQFHFWQIITHMFMHSKVFLPHIVFNMLGVWMFGSPLEAIWGRNKFLFFYFSAGVGAFLFTSVIDYFTIQESIKILIINGFERSDIIDTLNKGNVYTNWKTILGPDQYEEFIRTFTTGALGASGALMGILVAFGFLFPEAKLMMLFLPIPIKAKYFIPLLVGYDLISGFTGGTSVFGVNVGHWAHVGGALTGLIIALYWRKNSFNGTNLN